MQYTQEQIKDRFNKLPASLNEAMGSDHATEVIGTVAEQNGLSPKSKQALVHVIGYTMLGFIKMRDFVDELEREAQIDHDTAVAVAKVIHKQLFMPVRDAMLNAYGGTFKMNMDGQAPVPRAPVQHRQMVEAPSQAEPQATASPITPQKEEVPPPSPALEPVQASVPESTPLENAPEKPYADVPEPELPALEKKQLASEPITFMPGNLPGAEEMTEDEQGLDREEVLHAIEDPKVEQPKEEIPVAINKNVEGVETPGPHAAGANFMEERLNATTVSELKPQREALDIPKPPKPPTHADYGSGDPYREPIS